MWILHILLLILCNSCCVCSTKFQTYEKGSVSISCVYDSKHRDNLKYMCRGNQSSTCLQQAVITSDNRRNGRFRLSDDKVSRKFTVTITSLTQEDSGMYLCGVHSNTGLDVFSAVELEVKVLPQPTSTVTPLITEEPVTPLITEEPVSSHTTQISEKTIKASIGCLLLIAPVVLFALLSLTFALFMVYKYCKLKGTGVITKNTWRNSEAEEMVKDVDIYRFQEDVVYAVSAKYKQRNGSNHVDKPDEEQRESTPQILTLAEVYSDCQ